MSSTLYRGSIDYLYLEKQSGQGREGGLATRGLLIGHRVYLRSSYWLTRAQPQWPDCGGMYSPVLYKQIDSIRIRNYEEAETQL